MIIRHLVAVAVGGALGSLSRYGVSSGIGNLLAPSGFPWGTWVVNAIGCLAIGAVAGVGARHGDGLPTGVWLFCVTGFLGGFTTFSAFGFETWTLLTRHEFLLAAFNVVSQCVIGLGAVSAGFWLLNR